MKIEGIDAFQVEYRYAEKGAYVMSGGRALESFTSTIVKILTDEGLTGFGEVCPLGSAYMEAYAKGVPSGIQELGPVLIDQDPCQVQVINDLMDSAMEGHNYVKSPIDVACWDILGQAAGLPVCTMLGGRYVDRFPLYRAISQHASEEMAQDVARFRSEGYRKFQLKAGGEPDEDIQRIRAALEVLEPGDILVADANRGWLMPQALRVVNAVVGKNVYIEQPCRTLEECLVVRNHTDLPLVLDEIVINVEALVNAWGQRALDILNIKFSRSGGLTKSKLLRDMCQAFGIIMTIEDCWGGDITTATIAHLAGSTRPEFLFTATDFNSYIDLEVAPDAPRREAGKLPVPTAPGLGIHVDEKVLGDPVVSIR